MFKQLQQSTGIPNELTPSEETKEVLSMTPVIRLADEKDIVHILELYRELAVTTSQVESSKNPSLDDFRRVFAKIRSTPGFKLLVAEEQGKVVGTMVILIVPNLSHGGSPWAYVDNLVIAHRYRRKGLGRMLMNNAIALSKEAGCYKIVLTCDKRLREAYRFYRSLSFRASAHGFRLYF